MRIKHLIDDRMRWSIATFGKGLEIERVIKHLRQEVEEASKNPEDIFEWIDIIFLALDGAGRMGYTSTQILDAMYEKHKINSLREWEKGKDGEPHSHKEPK